MALNNPYALDLPSGYIDIDVDGLAVNDPDIGDFTIECWMYIRGGYYNLSTGANASDTGIVMSYQGGSPVVGVKTKSDYYRLYLSVDQYPINRWAHFALTWDKNKKEAKYYLNGNYISTLPRVGSGASKSNRTYLRINAPSNITSYQGNAIYDELRIWNVVRTEEEIKRTMNKYLTALTPGLQRLIRFDDNFLEVVCSITNKRSTIVGNVFKWVEGEQDLYYVDIVFPSDVIQLPRNSYTFINFDVTTYDSLEYQVEVIWIDGLNERLLYQGTFIEKDNINIPISTHNLVLGKEYLVKVKVSPISLPNEVVEKTVIVKLKSSKPDIYLDLKGYDLSIDIKDEDDDNFVYTVKLNGTSMIPSEDGWAYAKGNVKFIRKLNSTQIQIGRTNTIQVFVQDEAGLSNEFTYSFIGEYFGLLFADEDYNLYTTDIGEILRILRFRTLRAGDVSDVYKVLLINKQPYGVRDIRLKLSYGGEVPQTSLKLSKTSNPFVPENELFYEGVFKPYEEIEFFVRLYTSKGARGVGKFNVIAKAIPVIMDGGDDYDEL